MKYLLKIFIFLSLIICAKQISAQVSGVQFALAYNSNTNLYDCYLYITEGNATSSRDRVQFNAQYAVVVPTGVVVKVYNSYMPLIDNRDFKGKQPVEWAISSKIISPRVRPGIDVYGITPSLAPTAFYNKLTKGDMVKLFSLKIEGEKIDLKQVRIFDNNTDPKSHELGMKSGDFSNGFTIGGFHQKYEGIKVIQEDRSK